MMVMHLLEERNLDGVVLSDTDVVWLRRPHELFAQHKTADVLISSDCLSLQVHLQSSKANVLAVLPISSCLSLSLGGSVLW